MNKQEKTIVTALSTILVLMALAVIALSLLAIATPAHAQGFFKKKADPAQPAASAAAPVASPPPVPVPAPAPMTAPAPQPLPAAAPSPSAPAQASGQASALPPVPPSAPLPVKPVPSKAQAPIPMAKPAHAGKPVRPAAKASAPSRGQAAEEVSSQGMSNAVRPLPSQPVVTQKNPAQVCTESNFVARAICVSVTCLLPDYKGAAECVKLEEDRVKRERSRETYGGH